MSRDARRVISSGTGDSFGGGEAGVGISSHHGVVSAAESGAGFASTTESVAGVCGVGALSRSIPTRPIGGGVCGAGGHDLRGGDGTTAAAQSVPSCAWKARSSC
jgi:hypothetical protein